MPSYQRVPIFMAPDLADTVSVPAPGTVGHVLTVTSTSPLVLAWQAGGGGGTSDHAALSHLAWTASGHTGTAGRLAGFDGTGAATTYAIGTDVQAYSATLATVAAGTWTGATSLTTLGDVTTCTALAAGASGALSVAGNSTTWKLRASGTGSSVYAAEFVGTRINSTHPGVSMVTLAARASGASPAGLSSGDVMWEHYAVGHDGASYYAGARVRVVCTATPSSGVIPTKWEWYTTSTGGATLVQATLDSASGLTLTTPLAIASGGTGASTAAAAVEALGGEVLAELADASSISGSGYLARSSILRLGELIPVAGGASERGIVRVATQGTVAYNSTAIRALRPWAQSRYTFTNTTAAFFAANYVTGTEIFECSRLDEYYIHGGFALSAVSSPVRGGFGWIAVGGIATLYDARTATAISARVCLEGGTLYAVVGTGAANSNTAFATALSADTNYRVAIRMRSSLTTFTLMTVRGVLIEEKTIASDILSAGGFASPGEGFVLTSAGTQYMYPGAIYIDLDE